MRQWTLKAALAVALYALGGFAGAWADDSSLLFASPLQMADSEFQAALANWGDGKSAEAESLLKHALVLRTQALGQEDPAVADVIERLGAIDYNRRQYLFAEDKFRQALTIYKQSYGEQNLQTLHAMGDLAATFREEGRYSEALPLAERSLAVRRETLAPNDPAIAGSLNNLGRLYLALGRYQDSRKALEEALRIHQSWSPMADSYARDDQALLQRVAEAEKHSADVAAGAYRLLVMAMAAGAAIIIFGILIIGCTLRAEQAYARDPPSLAPSYVAPLAPLAQTGFLIARMLFGVGIADTILALTGRNLDMARAAAGAGAVVAISLFQFILQYLTNIARRTAGLTSIPLTLFGRQIGPTSSPVQTGQPTAQFPWFPAVEYHATAANHVFKVFAAPHALCGARLGGTMASFLSAPGQVESGIWTQTALARAYDRLDPESGAFLLMHPANFQIRWNDISSLDYVSGRKWGLGAVPHKGWLVIHLRSGDSRELVLPGNQDGAAVRDELERQRTKSVAGGENVDVATAPAAASGES